MQEFAVGLVGLLSSLNRALSSAVVILAFSLLVYILTHNLRSSVARSFSALIACVCITYAGDVALFETVSLESAIPWLRFQWIGIAFTPATYLHFSDALLRHDQFVVHGAPLGGACWLFGRVGNAGAGLLD